MDMQYERTQLLRWAGSKRQSARVLSAYLDFDSPYVEPFCGSASFFFLHRPKHAKLNDTNRSLIGFYKTLRNQPKDLWDIYSRQKVNAEAYYAIRQRYNALRAGVRKASYFLYLNHFCFNGLYRTNRNGEFNTPIGSHDQSKTKLGLAQLLAYSAAAKSASFYASDFEDFLVKANPTGSCIYMDPPYVTHDVRVFDEYGKRAFSIDDLHRLKAVAKKYSKHNRVVISYKDCTEFRTLFSRYIVRSIPITRNVGGFAGRRKLDTELVAVLGSQ